MPGALLFFTATFLCVILSHQLVPAQSIEDGLVEALVRRWAPYIWMAPNEKFFPLGADEFLQKVTAIPGNSSTDHVSSFKTIPVGPGSEAWYLVTDTPIESLLKDRQSYLYGVDPAKQNVPVYAVINRCAENGQKIDPDDMKNEISPELTGPSKPYFQVTYWLFFPYNKGKHLCTYNFGFFGFFPIPFNFMKCNATTYGNHVGDWEHVSMWFNGDTVPQRIYVSTHDAGAFYQYNPLAEAFVYEKQELRKVVLPKPKFPQYVRLNGTHPILFCAEGSHGLWGAPGPQTYMKMPRIIDENGFGSAWHTWKRLEIIDPYKRAPPLWTAYRGKWGNRKLHCNLQICKQTDGPKGIPLDKDDFGCRPGQRRKSRTQRCTLNSNNPDFRTFLRELNCVVS